jgi:DNA primase
VRSIASMTQTSPDEIESLFELAQPVSRKRAAPPRAKRTPPVGLELQIMRILVAHPVLAMGVDQAALSAITRAASDHADTLAQLVHACQALGENANFAALAEQLRSQGSDYDQIIAEIAAEPESDVEAVRLELAGAIRQTRIKLIKADIEQLVATGLGSEEAKSRYRELMLEQEQLRRQAENEVAPR